MDSPAASSAASPKRKALEVSAQPTVVKKLKVANGGQIENLAALETPVDPPFPLPNVSPIDQETLDSKPQANMKKTKSDPITPLADAITNSAESHGEDFDFFTERPSPLQIKEQENHEKAVRRARALLVPPPVAGSKLPKPAAAPVASAPPVKEPTIAGPQGTAPDFAQRLSLQRMKTGAGNTLD